MERQIHVRRTLSHKHEAEEVLHRHSHRRIDWTQNYDFAVRLGIHYLIVFCLRLLQPQHRVLYLQNTHKVAVAERLHCRIMDLAR